MKPTGKGGWRKTAALVTGLVCAGAWATVQVRNMQDNALVSNMMAKKKTICMGRVLVDVPVDAGVSFSNELLDGFDIAEYEETDAEFGERLAAREIEIQASADRVEGKGPGGMIVARDLEAGGLKGRVLTFGRDHSYWFDNGRRIDREKVSVEAHAHAKGRSFSLRQRSASQDDAQRAEALLRHLQLRGEDEIPTAQGFCVWGAVFAEPLPQHTQESSAISLGIPGHSDASLRMMSIADIAPGPGLLARRAATDEETSLLVSLLVDKLRSGTRTVNGIDGEEALERFHELNFTTSYGFTWETRGRPGDVMQPFITMELQSGVSGYTGGRPVESSLRRDAMVVLWDTVMSSVRLHAGQPTRSAQKDKLAGSAALPYGPTHVRAPSVKLPQTMP